MRAGEIITLGTYPQAEDGGVLPIEWQVLEVREDRALIVSVKALDYQKYNEKVEKVTWKTCTLRTWLNETFLQKAFTEEERACLVPAETEPGVTDTVFCLSREETKRCLQDRRAVPSPYANIHGTYIPCEYARWWVRDNGNTKLLGGVVGHDGMFFGLGVKLLSVAVRPAAWIKV